MCCPVVLAEQSSTHLLNHQVSKWSSCSSTMWLQSKLLLSHRFSRISTRRISLRRGGEDKGKRQKISFYCATASENTWSGSAWQIGLAITDQSKQICDKHCNSPALGGIVYYDEWCIGILPCLIFGKCPLLPSGVSSTKVLLFRSVQSLLEQ